METTTLKVKFKLTGENKTKTIKVTSERFTGKCFSEMVDEIYCMNDNADLNKMFASDAYIIGVEQLIEK